ncbi:MAG: hypothetical protein LBH36_01720 [Candidatus Nomurabacteria bacterium]|nr:hypothetical protein [Candidatus Nomurabacteria bacterium]
MRPIFFSVCGVGGCGKSTTINGLKKIFKSNKLYFTREVGGVGSSVAEAIRGIILSNDLPKMDALTEEQLVLATRIAHMYDVVLPKLASDIHVICDRCLLSSLAIQGYLRGIGIEVVYDDHVRIFKRFPTVLGVENPFKTIAPVPDVIYFLDLPMEDSLRRLQGRDAKDNDRIDLEPNDSYRLIYEGYQESIKFLQDKLNYHGIVRIDARGTPEEIVAEIANDIRRRTDS